VESGEGIESLLVLYLLAILQNVLWNPVKELKDQLWQIMYRGRLLMWNPVKELKVLQSQPPSAARLLQWNPVKELKGLILLVTGQVLMSVESGEGIESPRTCIHHGPRTCPGGIR